MRSALISFLFLLISAFSVYSQSNTWTCINKDLSTGVGYKSWSALVYADSNRFLSTMGWAFNGNWDPPSRYSELSLRLPDNRWINFLPNDTLYSKWADSTGNTLAMGANFETPLFKISYGYLRPGIFRALHKTFYQYAFDSDEKNIYYYLSNRLIRYSTTSRKWDTLVTTTQPTAIEGGTSAVKYGAMCYDPVNKELVLFGGADVDAKNGHFGTWAYKPATNTWSQVNSTIQPPPRCQSQMAYDAKNKVIVLFGGDHLDYLTSDTWIYNCTSRSWEEKRPSVSPSPRAGHALLYLPKSQTIVLFGGYTYKPINPSDGPSYYPGYKPLTDLEMWKYDVTANTWNLIKVFASTDIKPATLFQSIAAADTGDRIVALGDSSMYMGWIKQTFLLNCDPSVTDAGGTTSRGVSTGTKTIWAGAGNPAWFDSAVGTPNPDSLNQVYKMLPLNQWVKMTPPRNPYGARDWGTRVLSPDHDALMVWSGGHSAYCGSDVPQYSISTNRWHLGYAPELMLD
ncbi:MAG: hypothetical protein JNL74_19115, partial [Fibrobacteres bacterium]|nr:hypothetical protein [Fibrobacterota bacterium]